MLNIAFYIVKNIYNYIGCTRFTWEIYVEHAQLFLLIIILKQHIFLIFYSTIPFSATTSNYALSHIFSSFSFVAFIIIIIIFLISIIIIQKKKTWLLHDRGQYDLTDPPQTVVQMWALVQWKSRQRAAFMYTNNCQRESAPRRPLSEMILFYTVFISTMKIQKHAGYFRGSLFGVLCAVYREKSSNIPLNTDVFLLFCSYLLFNERYYFLMLRDIRLNAASVMKRGTM